MSQIWAQKQPTSFGPSKTLAAWSYRACSVCKLKIPSCNFSKDTFFFLNWMKTLVFKHLLTESDRFWDFVHPWFWHLFLWACKRKFKWRYWPSKLLYSWLKSLQFQQVALVWLFKAKLSCSYLFLVEQKGFLVLVSLGMSLLRFICLGPMSWPQLRLQRVSSGLMCSVWVLSPMLDVFFWL